MTALRKPRAATVRAGDSSAGVVTAILAGLGVAGVTAMTAAAGETTPTTVARAHTRGASGPVPPHTR